MVGKYSFKSAETHMTTPTTETPVAGSQWNPAKLDCFSCKGFKAIGICSHVVTCHHLMGKYDLLYNTEKFLTKKQQKSKGGNNKTVKPALVKEKPLPPRGDDSSDEEAVPLRLRKKQKQKR